MKKWLKIVGGCFGAFYSVTKDLTLWLGGKLPMDISQSIDVIVFKVIIVSSICYGMFLICQFFYFLNKSNKELHQFNNGQLSEYHDWLKSHPQAQYDEKSASLEIRIHSMLKWWMDTQK